MMDGDEGSALSHPTKCIEISFPLFHTETEEENETGN